MALKAKINPINTENAELSGKCRKCRPGLRKYKQGSSSRWNSNKVMMHLRNLGKAGGAGERNYVPAQQEARVG